MILLHHPEVELSRTLLDSLPEGVPVVDWGQPDKVEGYNGPPPSAFPSVVVDVPAYGADWPQYGPDGEFLGMERVIIPACQEALRMPANWAAVAQYEASVAARAVAYPPE